MVQEWTDSRCNSQVLDLFRFQILLIQKSETGQMR